MLLYSYQNYTNKYMHTVFDLINAHINNNNNKNEDNIYNINKIKWNLIISKRIKL